MPEQPAQSRCDRGARHVQELVAEQAFGEVLLEGGEGFGGGGREGGETARNSLWWSLCGTQNSEQSSDGNIIRCF